MAVWVNQQINRWWIQKKKTLIQHFTFKPGIWSGCDGPDGDGPACVGCCGDGPTCVGCCGDGPDGDCPLLLSITGPVGDPTLVLFILNTELIKSSKLCWLCATVSTLNKTIINFCMLANWKKMNEKKWIELLLFEIENRERIAFALQILQAIQGVPALWKPAKFTFQEFRRNLFFIKIDCRPSLSQLSSSKSSRIFFRFFVSYFLIF